MMKKRIALLALITLAMLCLGLFVSCSNEAKTDGLESDRLVYGAFDRGKTRSTGSSYTQTVTLKEINDVFWTYEATKADTAGYTGVTTAEKAVKGEAYSYESGLDGVIGPFSQGLWDFDVYGYKEKADSQPDGTDWVKVADNTWYSGKIYYGSVTDVVELKDGTEDNPDPIDVIINLVTEGIGTFTISSASDFKWYSTGGDVSSSGDGYTIDMYLKLVGRMEDNSSQTDYIKLSYDETSSSYKIADGQTTTWSNSNASTWTVVCSIVRAKYTTEGSYTDLNTYATSPDLLVKVYTGQTTTLKANVIESNLAYGKINGSLVDDIIKESTVTTTVVAEEPTVLTSSVTPASSSSSKKTTVTIPSEVASFTEGSTATLTLSATPILTANSLFLVSDTTGAVGAIDLTATVKTGDLDPVKVDKFTNSDGGAVEVLVETYVAMGMTNVTLSYTDGTDTQTWSSTYVSTADEVSAPTTSTADDGKCYYDSATGRLVYKTTHFSTFLVGADQNVYDSDNQLVYKLDKKTGDTEYRVYDKNGDEVTNLGNNLVLLDCLLSNEVPDSLMTKTWEVIHHNCEADTRWHEESSNFSSGYGTKLEPYIIADKAQFQNVTDMYDKYAYYKIKDEVNEIDCSNWTSVKLFGSFDGNGVKLSGIDNTLFRFVGKLPDEGVAKTRAGWDTTPITLKDFEANYNFEGTLDIAVGLIFQVNGNNTTTFDNVTVSGRMVGGANSGVFVSYTGPNYYDTDPDLEQKIVFKDCSVTADIITTSSSFGVLAGYPGYCNHDIAIECNKTLDDLIANGHGYTESGKLSLFAISGGYRAAGDSLNKGVITYSGKNSEAANATTTTNCTKLTAIDSTYKEGTGYSISWADTATRMVVYITAQLSETDKTTKETTSVRGITLGLTEYGEHTKGISETEKVVLGVVNSIELLNKQNSYGAELSSGKLTCMTAGETNYTYGTIKLQVAQYDLSGKMVAYTIKVIGELNYDDFKNDSDWTVKK